LGVKTWHATTVFFGNYALGSQWRRLDTVTEKENEKASLAMVFATCNQELDKKWISDDACLQE
jgi:hypothetical protein